MSASLVGSEMCIRDSSSSPRHHRSSLAHFLKTTNTPQAPGLLAKGPPVSYTHLTLPTICSV
eukprot:2906368-Alexandrium_andersonii.AAC.1